MESETFVLKVSFCTIKGQQVYIRIYHRELTDVLKMSKKGLKNFPGEFLFKKANKAYEKKKAQIIAYIEEEKKNSDKSTLEIIDNIAKKDKEDSYWIWLIYVLDLELKIDEKTYENSYFSGRCIDCKHIFTFTETQKDREEVKCDNCQRTYTPDDMLECCC